jgi:aspartate-semialdehyde dehydrogenase
VTRLAVLHPTNLVAQELRQRLDAEPGLWQEILLLTTSPEDVGTLTEARGGAAVVQAYRPELLEGVDVAFLCGPMAANRPILEQLPDETRAIVLSPDAEPEVGLPLVEGINLVGPIEAQVLLSPNPGAIHLAFLLDPLRELGLRRAVATLLQPASIFGGSALDDLLEQARELLSFQPVSPSDSFDQQVVFNLLPTDLPVETISRELEAVLGPGLALAAQVVQAGVFHSSAASLYFELSPDPGPEALQEALGERELLELRRPDEAPLGPVDAAASERVLVGHLHPVPSPPGGYWMWSAMDNLSRGGALNALAIAKAILQA